jgi:small subunit ribosomal protein S6
MILPRILNTEEKMEPKTKLYEGMFLLDAGNPDFEATSAPLKTVLARSGAELLAAKPWDERRLAYEVLGRKRGLYVLTYFRVDPLKVAEIEHDCQLDERILRALILRRETIKQEEIDAATPITGAPPREIEPVVVPAASAAMPEIPEVPGITGDEEEKA